MSDKKNLVTKEFTLPNGVLHAGEVLREVELVRFDGDHEDLIHDKKNLREGNALEKLIKSCVVRIGDITDPETLSKVYDKALIMPDQNFILIKLRMFGIGRMYEFVAECPRCEKEDSYTIDLDTLVLDEQPEDCRGKTEFTAIIEPEDEDVFQITFKHLYAGDGKMLSIIKKDYGKERVTRELALQLKTINGKPASDPKIVKALSWKARNAIRAAMDATVGGLNTELIMECKNCDGREFRANMPIELRSFFYPKGRSKETPRQAKPFLGFGGTKLSLETDTDGNQAK
jgi:hypothetical protein